MIKKILLLLIILLLVRETSAIGIGVSPSSLDFKELLRGGYAEKEIVVSNPDNTKSNCYVDVEGNISKWVSFEPNKFSVDARSFKKIKVIINPPGNIPNGEYSGRVIVKSNPKGDVEKGVGMVAGAAVALNVDVEISGKEIIDSRVGKIEIGDTEKDSPAQLLVEIENLGNVIIKPWIKVEILNFKQDRVLSREEFKDIEILPTKLEAVKRSISTTGLDIGQYYARISVYLNDKLLRQEVLLFEIFEKGTLIGKGILKYIENNAWAETNEIVKIIGVFENTGQIPLEAWFEAEILYDNKIIEIVKSELLMVYTNETINMTSYFTPKNEGVYYIKGKVYYLNKFTEEKESVLNVVSKVPITGLAFLMIPGKFSITLLLILIVLILFIIFWMRRKKKKDS